MVDAAALGFALVWPRGCPGTVIGGKTHRGRTGPAPPPRLARLYGPSPGRTRPWPIACAHTPLCALAATAVPIARAAAASAAADAAFALRGPKPAPPSGPAPQVDALERQQQELLTAAAAAGAAHRTLGALLAVARGIGAKRWTLWEARLRAAACGLEGHTDAAGGCELPGGGGGGGDGDCGGLATAAVAQQAGTGPQQEAAAAAEGHVSLSVSTAVGQPAAGSRGGGECSNARRACTDEAGGGSGGVGGGGKVGDGGSGSAGGGRADGGADGRAKGGSGSMAGGEGSVGAGSFTRRASGGGGAGAGASPLLNTLVNVPLAWSPERAVAMAPIADSSAEGVLRAMGDFVHHAAPLLV
jgi:hypothetical protein